MPYSHPDELHATFAEAFAAGNVDALLDLYEIGAIQLQQDGRVLRGSDSFRSTFDGLLRAGVTMTGTQQRTLITGDLALTSTHYTFEPPGEGDNLAVHVATAEVSRQQHDGTWRVVIDAPAFA